MFLRNKLVHNPSVNTWHLSLLFSLAQDITASCWNPESGYLDGECCPVLLIYTTDIDAETTASDLVVQYNKLITKIEELGLDAMLSAKPLLNV